MVNMRHWVVILFSCIGFSCCSLAFAQLETAYKAQYGWGLPRQIASSSITQGVVIDSKRLIIAESTGLEQRDLRGENPKLLLEHSGIRDLQGTGSAGNLALAWYRRDTVNANGVWWWYKGQVKLALETPYTDFSLIEVAGKPVLIGIAQQGTLTAVVLLFWGEKPRTIFSSKLNVGALAANTVAGRIGIVFAEGFRNGQDEKYDLRFLQLTNLEKKLPDLQSELLAPAVYLGREQRFGVARQGNQLLPIWWYETPDEQRLAAFTKQHNPRLALYDNKKIVEFAPPAPYLGQIDNALYYVIKDQIISYDLKTKVTRVEITAPSSFSSANLSNQGFMAWQSVGRDGFSSQLWLVDSAIAFNPTLVDQISKVLGWNPWFPVQNLLGQTALSLMLSALAVLLVAPLVWLLRGRFDFGQGTWFGMGCAWVVLLLGRIVSGGFNASNWIFAPLLTAPWLIILLGTALGSGLVFWQRKRLNGTELGATIAASLVVLVGTFITVFSRIGFLKF
jgi:hypothetical protein